jgi:ferredoxin/flavodoxin---NADP+ reductase
VYVVGWARKASEGLVGIARHDGETGANHVLQYLSSALATTSSPVEEITRALERKDVQAVSKSDLQLLTAAEEREARSRGLAWYKYSEDEAMLSAIEEQKSGSLEGMVSVGQ